ncbi:MAG TPA: HAMP domain-containing sensor histidine kinase, partial [Thermomicrobiales bacterium]|nr:HAMP domain-containing sensor histidine kinase [Thermomicrobiales bacterium]
AMRVEDLLVDGQDWTDEEYIRYLSEGPWLGEIELRRKGGKRVPVEVLATVVELPTGPVYLSALRDVSERHRLERLRRDFLAMVTHDLRTPLTTVRGNAQLLKRRAEYRPAQVDAVLAATAQMQQLINNLADVVVLEGGSVALRKVPVDLTVLVDEVAKELQDAFEARRVTIDTPATAVFGAWDRARLKQVLTNLMENALKYAAPDSDVVVQVEDCGDEARVTVKDQGLGIAPEHLPRLFDRFYRADVTGVGGLGLGLYISRMLLEAHGGRIWAESEVGQGSTFTLALPKHA